ncbi:hypothetical protein [Lactococcus lactis]|uniref:hypothetical protein n=1 Tax=Lactococcus lactis TaxID=1358 RepID=UPI0024A92568|nr:hypothetical protein [Lactococcus lactis]
MRRKISIAIAALAFVFIVFINPNLNVWSVMIPAVFLVLIVNLDLSEISEVGPKGIKLRKETERAKRLNDEMQKDLESFKEVNQSLLKYSLGTLQKEGLFDMMTSPERIIEFVESSEKLSKEIGIEGEVLDLLNMAKSKAVSSFSCQIGVQFPELQEEALKAISDGYRVENGVSTYSKELVKINFDALRDLSSKLNTPLEKESWKQLLNKFEAFYQKNF